MRHYAQCCTRYATGCVSLSVSWVNRAVQGYTGLAASTQHMSPATLESLAHLSRLLYTHPTILDVLSLRVPPVELAAAGLAFLEDLEGAGVGKLESFFETVGLIRTMIFRGSSVCAGPVWGCFTLASVASYTLRGKSGELPI
jgi:hypothetical protein